MSILQGKANWAKYTTGPWVINKPDMRQTAGQWELTFPGARGLETVGSKGSCQ